MSNKFKFSKRSLDRLQGVHCDLQMVGRVALARSPIDFGITEGLRSKERQEYLKASGKSQTLNSRHLTGHAIDIVCYKDGKITWDFAVYEEVAKIFKEVAKELDIAMVWGGDWQSLKDGVHFELDRKKYPNEN